MWDDLWNELSVEAALGRGQHPSVRCQTDRASIDLTTIAVRDAAPDAPRYYREMSQPDMVWDNVEEWLNGLLRQLADSPES